jgi:hypothetical protein
VARRRNLLRRLERAVRKASLLLGAPILLALLAACSGAAPTPTPRSSAPTAVPSATPTPAAEPEATPTPAASLDGGAKPGIALTRDGNPVIAYMEESNDGFVKVARRDGDGWAIEEISTGYFYGPLDIAISHDDTVHVAYHDHQGLTLNLNRGDAVYAVSTTPGVWEVAPVVDRGHDGWHNRLTTDVDDQPHMSGIDPAEFGGQGVEYYGIDASGAWFVETIGTGPQTYQFATSVAVTQRGTPYITYYSQEGRDLGIGVRNGADDWTLSLIDEEGDVGLFSELVIDSSGRFHVSYLARQGLRGAVIKYATRPSAGGAWVITEVGTLDNILIGQSGARHATSIALDSSGTPWIAYVDTTQVRVATLDGGKWRSDRAAEPLSQATGQLISLSIAGDGTLHIAYYDSPRAGFAAGVIMYVKGTPAA